MTVLPIDGDSLDDPVSEPASRLVYDVAEAAALLRVSDAMVHELRVRDRFPLPAIQPLGPRGRVLIPVAALERWLADETADPTRGWPRKARSS